MLLGPMLGIPLILLAFVFYSDKHVTFKEHGTTALPANQSSVSHSSYYTSVDATEFVLVSSWASTASQFVIPPFMLLFSFFVAREITRQCDAPSTVQEVSDHMLQGLLKGSWPELWAWVKYTARRERRSSELRALHVAAVGSVLAVFFA
jgi:hypothetical protein